jgi:hypothetical protein
MEKDYLERTRRPDYFFRLLIQLKINFFLLRVAYSVPEKHELVQGGSEFSAIAG